MDLEGAISRRPAESRTGADFLISDAVSLVVACIEGSEVREDQVAPLLHDVHQTLLGIAVSSGALPGMRPAAPSGRDDDAQVSAVAEGSSGIGEREMEILKDMGVSVAEIRRAVAPVAETVTAVQPQEVHETFLAEEAGAPLSGSVVPASTEPKPPMDQDQPRAAKAVAATPSSQAAPTSEAPAQARSRQKPAGAPKAAKPKPPALRLPAGIKSADEALRMNTIVCLDDGKRIKDLSAHLTAKGVSTADYKAKWGLPREYPTQAPSRILKSGATYEVDFATRRFKPVR